MDSSYARSRGKRSFSYHDRESSESNGRHKRHASATSRSGPIAPPLPRPAPGDTVFRILCPEGKAGSVIGKGGSIIKKLRQETGARITIADAVQGADDRVILISASDKDRDHAGDWEKGRERDGRERDNSSHGSREREREDIDSRDRDARHREGLSAQEALLKVHSRIVEGGTLNGSDIEEEDPLRTITTRLLVPNSQVGCLLGKGGKIIEQMREETKAQIRILPRDQLSLCTLPSHEIVQIVGDVDVVKKALHLISTRLCENPPRERAQSFSSGPRSPERRVLPPEEVTTSRRNSLGSRGSADGHHRSFSSSYSHSETGAGVNSEFTGRLQVSRSAVADVGWQSPAMSEELVFRILCPNDKIGSIIGRGGSIIRNLQEEIGVRIRVSDSLSGSDERIVIISSVEHLDDNISPAQEALLHVQSKIADLGPDEDAVITSRLLVPSNQVGCLLGKGGSIIAEMRRSTRANIRILGKDELPKCALSTDELVQIVGDIRVAREALIQVTKRLRTNLYQERSLSNPGGGVVTSLSSVSQRQRDHGSPRRMHSSFSGSGIHSGVRSSSSYQSLSASPARWVGQDVLGGRSLGEFDNPSLQQGSELFRSTGALVTKTTVEVVIPERVVSSIIGNGGNTVAQIRQMSGAKVNLLEVRPGALERIVEISGTPEQTHAAQSLLQAFILSAQTSSYGYTG